MEPQLQQTYGPHFHPHGLGPLTSTCQDGHIVIHWSQCRGGRSPPAAISQSGHAPLPHTARFWPWLPLGTPSCSLSGSDKGNYLTAELSGWLLRHLPEISCGQCVAEVNAVVIMNALLVCLFSAEILSARRSDNNMLLSSFWIM